MNTAQAEAAAPDTAPAAIETVELCKSYGPIRAVDRLTLRIRLGEVYGFLGPNGAGKTTTMRMLAGLVRPSAGDVRVLGRPAGDSWALERVGAVIEAPAFYPYLSGADNLRIVARHAGVPPERVRDALERVSLSGRERDRFAAYSLGMKQRLGLAAALLKEPQVLILDEPANGLDPAGVAEMRTLTRSLAADGRAVFVSSHQLGEIEQTCDRIGVLSHGRLVAEGTLSALRGRRGLTVVARPLASAAAQLRDRFGPERVAVRDGQIDLDVDPAQASGVNRALVEAGVDVEEIRSAAESLESVFLALTEKDADAPTGKGGR